MVEAERKILAISSSSQSSSMFLEENLPAIRDLKAL